MQYRSYRGRQRLIIIITTLLTKFSNTPSREKSIEVLLNGVLAGDMF